MDRSNKANTICIIPARGGSKRIPGKNIKNFCGKPILAYSIKNARSSGLCDRVIVSTDSEKIQSVAEKYGGEVPKLRSKENSDDHATLTDVLWELEPVWSNYNHILLLLPTAPLIESETIKMAFEEYISNNADTLVPVTTFSFAIQRAFIIDSGKLKLREPDHEMTRSQDLENFYHDIGAFYIINTSKFRENKTIYGKKAIPFIMNELQCQDIDTLSDWKIAELKYKLLHEK